MFNLVQPYQKLPHVVNWNSYLQRLKSVQPMSLLTSFIATRSKAIDYLEARSLAHDLFSYSLDLTEDFGEGTVWTKELKILKVEEQLSINVLAAAYDLFNRLNPSDEQVSADLLG